MAEARYVVGDVFEVLSFLPENSVDLVFTSPPFLALRSYLPADHPDKAKEIGSEPTPADFIDTMLDVAEACDRVLAPHGSLVFELGDTYSGSGGAGGDYNADGLREGQEKFDGSSSRSRTGWHRAGKEDPERYRAAGAVDSGSPNGGTGWPLAKSLTGIPTLFAWSLAYGRNLLRPERITEPWRIRNLIAWVRPNPPVGALGDKFRPATSYLTVACKSDKRYFDLDAVRTDPQDDRPRNTNGPKALAADVDETQSHFDTRTNNPAGAPPLDWWKITPSGFTGSHYAVFPPELCIKPIKAMCPERVCRTCGEPSRRITEETKAPTGRGLSERDRTDRGRKDRTRGTETVRVETLGWTDCGHDDYRPGVVLDPFAGTGTTLMVATGHGRDAIGIDIDSRNADLAIDRVGPMFLTIEKAA